MSEVRVTTARRLRGELNVPGDKSISHRALLLTSVAGGESRIRGLSSAQDVSSTRCCLEKLGIEIVPSPDGWLVRGKGRHGFQPPAAPLDSGNSGTTIRLLSGLLAAQPFTSRITGDESLRRRPMRRIIEPLEMMGAQIESDNHRAPLTIHGGPLRAIDYASTIASAQVKSCVLLAALYARGTTRTTEPSQSRDHTERMLEAFGVTIHTSESCAAVAGPADLSPCELSIPGDISSASFFMVAACLVPGSELVLKNVGANPTRLGVFDALAAMGAHLQMDHPGIENREPRADFRVNHSRLHSASFAGSMIPRIIDEVPILAVAATQAQGTTTMHDIEELRVKEADRLEAIQVNLQRMGAKVKAGRDSLTIQGPTPLRGAVIDSYGDHRIAMAFAIAGLIAEGETTIQGAECVDISYPAFFDTLSEVRDDG